MISFFSKEGETQLLTVMTEMVTKFLEEDESYQKDKAACEDMLGDDERTLAEVNSDRRMVCRCGEAMTLYEMLTIEHIAEAVLAMLTDQESLQKLMQAMAAQRVSALFHISGDEYFKRRK